MPELRDYQREAVGAVLAAWEAGMRRPALELATGAGKTVILAELARTVHHAFGWRTCVLVHRDELVNQTVNKLKDADPSISVGIVKGDRMGIFGDVVVASVQTLVRRLVRKSGADWISRDQFQLLITDECHHGEATSYKKIYEHFGKAHNLGVTATMARGDRRGLGGVWDDVVYSRTTAWCVEQGYLVPAELVSVAVPDLDTGKVKRSGGDLSSKGLADAMSSAAAGPIIAKAYREYGSNPDGSLRRAICFAPVVATAVTWAQDFERAGIRTRVITGETSETDRAEAYQAVAAGRADVLCSVMVLTEGFDLPSVEVCIQGRPTTSKPLLTQMVGRVLRPSPRTGKTSALVLDVVGAHDGSLASLRDLSIPAPGEEPDPDRPLREGGGQVAREVHDAPHAIAWVARELGGKVRKRPSSHEAPSWLRTSWGTAFLPPTRDWPFVVFARPEHDHLWWILSQATGKAQPLQLAASADPCDVHPGFPRHWSGESASERQAALLRKLRAMPEKWPTKREASDLINVHFVSRELHRAMSGL